MVQEVNGDRDLLSAYLDERSKKLGVSTQIPNVVVDDRDIGQYAEYSPVMESRDRPADEVVDPKTSEQSPNFFTQFFQQAFPATAQAAQEVYARPTLDFLQFEEKKRALVNIQGVIEYQIANGKPVDQIREQLYRYFTYSAEIVKSTMVHEKGFFTNDSLVRDIIAEALEQDKILIVQTTDREGMLFMNARLGVDQVDRGMDKQSAIAQSALTRINHLFTHMLPGVKARMNYCRRNVDENTFAIAIDPESVSEQTVPDQALDNYLSMLPDTDISTLNRQQKIKLLCETIVSGGFSRMVKEMGQIQELKTNTDGDVFDSYASGVWFTCKPDEFENVEDVLTTADTLSDLFKRARSKTINALPEEIIFEIANSSASAYFEARGIDYTHGNWRKRYQRSRDAMVRALTESACVTRMLDGTIGLSIPCMQEDAQIAQPRINRILALYRHIFADEPVDLEHHRMVPAHLAYPSIESGFVQPLEMLSPLSNLQRLIRKIHAPSVIHLLHNPGKSFPASLGHENLLQLTMAWTQGRITCKTIDKSEREESAARYRQQTALVQRGIIPLMDFLNDGLLRNAA